MTDTVDRLATVAIIVAAVIVVWIVARPDESATPPPLPVPTASITRGAATEVLADGDTVALVVYSDFQCPFCASFAQQIMQPIEAEFRLSNRVQIQFRPLPLSSIHPMAERAAAFAHCAGRQDKFRETHDVLFANQAKIPSGLDWVATEVGLDRNELQRCADGDGKLRIASALEEARALGFMSTPTILVGRLQSDGSIRVLQRLDSRSLADVRSAVRSAMR